MAVTPLPKLIECDIETYSALLTDDVRHADRERQNAAAAVVVALKTYRAIVDGTSAATVQSFVQTPLRTVVYHETRRDGYCVGVANAGEIWP